MKAKSLNFILKMDYVQEQKLKVPMTMHGDKAVFLKCLSANDQDYANFAIVDVDLMWYDLF